MVRATVIGHVDQPSATRRLRGFNVPMSPMNTVITNTSVFRNDSSIALVIHFKDGQSYRINTTDEQQLRIGVEGLKMAFPHLIQMSDQAVCRNVLTGVINNLPLSYELVHSKKLDGKGQPYKNVRLTPNLVEAQEADLDALLGFNTNDGL